MWACNANSNEQVHCNVNHDGVNLTFLGGIMRGRVFDDQAIFMCHWALAFVILITFISSMHREVSLVRGKCNLIPPEYPECLKNSNPAQPYSPLGGNKAVALSGMHLKNLRTSGMWIFRRKPSIVNAASFCTLYHFMNIAFALKDDILLTLPSTHPVDEPPNVLLPAIKTFLGASCSLDDGGIDLTWSLLKALVWTGNVPNKSDTGGTFERPGQQCGVAEIHLFPPYRMCPGPDCSCTKRGLALHKVWQQRVVLFTLASGPCVAKAAHFYCEACKTDYFHNYSVSRAASDPQVFDPQDLDTMGEMTKPRDCTYYTTVPANIQVAEHMYIECQVIELFITSMEVSWTSATNCARLYNIALRLGKEAPQDYPV
ncbi:hypothetical protein BDR03DRAFT_981532 [Suillus americanus]|nr:hypothetical protein BDR03DRAFT_981532 [Suillus americanus]